MTTLKIGELAKRTGLTVRTLHHYDAIGLLVPEERSNAGYRLYGRADLQRLQQIVSMRALGLSLHEIGEMLAAGDADPLATLDHHIALLDKQMEAQRRLRDRLDRLRQAMRSAGGVSADELLKTLEEITMPEKHYTPQQLRLLDERAKTLGPERIREVEAEWPELIAEVRAEMQKGTDPADPRVQELVRRWQALVEEFTGGDPGITRSLGNLYQDREDAERIKAQHGAAVPDPEVFDYIGRAAVIGGRP